MKIRSILAAVAAAGCLIVSGNSMAANTVSGKLAKPLKAAQEALTAHNYNEAVTKVKEAQALGGATAYDTFVMDSFLISAYAGLQQHAPLVPLLESRSKSQFASAEMQRTDIRTVMGIYFESKDCGKTVEAAQEVIRRGFQDNQTYLIMAQCQGQSGQYKQAAQTIQDVIGKQEHPDEKLLSYQWNMYYKAGDTADADRVIERLVVNYPKPDYWQNAMAPLLKDVKDSHLQLNIYRLMYEVGVLHRPGDVGEMAGLALEQGYPGEAQSVLEKAFANNMFTEPSDKDRYQHTLSGAKLRADKDRASLPANEASAKTGDQLVQIGAGYMSYGQFDKAVTAISNGIAKGGLKSPDEANILLGMAQFRAHDSAGAMKTFTKEESSSNTQYARLAKLWTLHVEHG